MKFRFRWIPFVAMLVAAAIGITAGNWQTRRAEQKESIERRLAERERGRPVDIGAAPQSADDVEFRRVTVRGEFLPRWTVYLDNRPHAGRAGFYVAMPLKIAGSDMHVLVLRGWVPRDVRDRARLPAIATPAGLVEVEGIARTAPAALMQLGDAVPPAPGAIVQNLTPAQFAAASGLATQGFVVEQTSDTGDGLVRDWPRPSLGIDKHRGYAFQWYGLAATAFAFFIVTGLRRGKRDAGN